MATVTNTVKLPDGTTPNRVDVTIELVASTTGRAAGWITANDRTIESVVRPTVTDGAWTADLTPNDDIDPAGTVYKVTEVVDRHSYTHYIDVPSGGGSVHDLLTSAPTVGDLLFTSVSDHNADAAAHTTLYGPGRTDVPVTDGGTGSSTAAGARSNLVAAKKVWVDASDYATGDGTTDDTATIKTALAAASGGQLFFPAGTYVVDMASPPLVPNNTTITVGFGATILGKPNSAAGASIYRLFGYSSSTPTNIRFNGGGKLDGNRRNGNHGASENVFGIHGSDVVGLTVENLTFTNFRSEGVYVGRSSVQPSRIAIRNCVFEDCGFYESGDSNTSNRMGVAVISADDVIVSGNIFDTIAGYAVDIEANGAGDTFDNIVVGPNVYRDCGQGYVNVFTDGGTAENIHVLDKVGSGDTGANTPIVPNVMRVVRKQRTAGDVTPSNSWGVVDANLDIALPAQEGDFIRVELSTAWSNGSTFGQLDVASMVDSAAVRYWSSNSASQASSGIVAWRGASGVASWPAGGVVRRVESDEIVDGIVTLRLLARLNSVTSKTLAASSTDPLVFMAHNLGPQG